MLLQPSMSGPTQRHLRHPNLTHVPQHLFLLSFETDLLDQNSYQRERSRLGATQKGAHQMSRDLAPHPTKARRGLRSLQLK